MLACFCSPPHTSAIAVRVCQHWSQEEGEAGYREGADPLHNQPPPTSVSKPSPDVENVRLLLQLCYTATLRPVLTDALLLSDLQVTLQ